MQAGPSSYQDKGKEEPETKWNLSDISSTYFDINTCEGAPRINNWQYHSCAKDDFLSVTAELARLQRSFEQRTELMLVRNPAKGNIEIYIPRNFPTKMPQQHADMQQAIAMKAARAMGPWSQVRVSSLRRY